MFHSCAVINLKVGCEIPRIATFKFQLQKIGIFFSMYNKIWQGHSLLSCLKYISVNGLMNSFTAHIILAKYFSIKSNQMHELTLLLPSINMCKLQAYLIKRNFATSSQPASMQQPEIENIFGLFNFQFQARRSQYLSENICMYN